MFCFVAVASASIYTGVLGFYSYWGPKAGKALFGMQQARDWQSTSPAIDTWGYPLSAMCLCLTAHHLSPTQPPQESADLVFGALTVLTGVIGTAAGGVALDRLGGGMESALALSAAAVAVACALLIPAFNMAQARGTSMLRASASARECNCVWG